VYAKVFTQIFDSTLADNWKHRHVFEDLLKLCDRYGIVDMTEKAIANRTRMPLKLIREALAALSSPDDRSRTKELEGRRIVLIDPARSWGWQIVNHQKYRDIKNEFDRTAYMRDYMRQRRSVKPKLDSSLTHTNTVKLSASVSASASTVPEGGVGETFNLPLSVQKQEFHNMQRFKWLSAELCELYKRRGVEVGRGEEEHLVAEVSRRPDVKLEFNELCKARAEIGERYFPQSLQVLCRDWDKTLDRARNHAPPPPPQSEVKSKFDKDSDRMYREIMGRNPT
jgi:hypothetical protein